MKYEIGIHCLKVLDKTQFLLTTVKKNEMILRCILWSSVDHSVDISAHF